MAVGGHKRASILTDFSKKIGGGGKPGKNQERKATPYLEWHAHESLAGENQQGVEHDEGVVATLPERLHELLDHQTPLGRLLLHQLLAHWSGGGNNH